jgi:hypothetical protein
MAGKSARKLPESQEKSQQICRFQGCFMLFANVPKDEIHACRFIHALCGRAVSSRARKMVFQGGERGAFCVYALDGCSRQCPILRAYWNGLSDGIFRQHRFHSSRATSTFTVRAYKSDAIGCARHHLVAQGERLEEPTIRVRLVRPNRCCRWLRGKVSASLRWLHETSNFPVGSILRG